MSRPASTLCAIACSLVSLGASAQTVRTAIEPIAPAQLGLIYLECARLSEQQRMPVKVFNFCSDIAELQRDRDFKGDFDAQLAWWRGARDTHQPTPSANPYVLAEPTCRRG